MTHTITYHEDAKRFELRVDSVLASIADYRVLGNRVTMPHTVTAPEYRGLGFAAEVVRAALDDARARGLQVVPTCWFVAEFIDSNPEYQDLTAAANASISPAMSEPAGE